MGLLQLLKRKPQKPVARKPKRVKPPPAEPKRWQYGHETCKAFTRSQARAQFKRRLGLPANGRLPKGTVVLELVDRRGRKAA